MRRRVNDIIRGFSFNMSIELEDSIRIAIETELMIQFLLGATPYGEDYFRKKGYRQLKGMYNTYFTARQQNSELFDLNRALKEERVMLEFEEESAKLINIISRLDQQEETQNEIKYVEGVKYVLSDSGDYRLALDN